MDCAIEAASSFPDWLLPPLFYDDESFGCYIIHIMIHFPTIPTNSTVSTERTTQAMMVNTTKHGLVRNKLLEGLCWKRLA